MISLSHDEISAKGRWDGVRFEGDGKGGTRIRGGTYENVYALADNGWQISLLRYHAIYEGTYEDGWRNVGGLEIPVTQYHFSAEGSDEPIPGAEREPRVYSGTMKELEARMQGLNDEDSVRNLMHTHGCYVDRKMWTDAIDLYTANATE